MKPKSTLRLFLLGSSLLAAPLANATIYYWDTNAATAGFGASNGTWNSGNTNLWSNNSAGTAIVNITTNSLDDINFGTATNAYSGTVTLAGNTTARSATFSGSSNVVLKGNGTARTLTLGSGGLTMNNTSTVTLGDGVAGNNVLINLGATGQTWTNNSSNNLTINNTVATFSRSAGGTITFNQAGAGVFSMSTTVLPNDATGIVGPWGFFGTGTSTSYAVNSSGTIAGYSAGTAAADADALISSTTNYDFSTTDPTTLTASRSANTLRYAGTGNVIDLGADGSNTLTANGILAVGSSGTLTIQRTGGTGTVVAGSTGTNSELVIAGPQNINITAPISNGLGTSALTYSGTGTLTLAGNNTYSGGTRVNSGTLTVNSTTALGATGSALGVNGTGTLDFNGFSSNVGAFNGDNGTVTNTAGGGAIDFTVGAGNNGGTFAGVIAGNLRLVKSGSGTLNLVGNNTYTGGTLITGGNINSIHANSFGTGQITIDGTVGLQSMYGWHPTLSNSITVNTGANLSLNMATQYYSITFNGALSGAGTITNTGNPGSATFANTANTFTGTFVTVGNTTTVNSLADGAGRIRFGTGTGTGGAFTLGANLPNAVVLNSRQIELNTTTGTGALLNNATNAASTITVNTNLLITATGNKTFTLSGSNVGNNTFAGTIVNATGSVISLSKTGNGTWIVSGDNTFTGGVTLSADGGNNGNGRLVLSGTNQFTGPITVNGFSGTATLAFTSIADFGTASALGKGTAGVSIQLGTGDTSHGRLEYIGSSNSSTDRTIQLGASSVGGTAGGEILNNGSGTLSFTAANLNTAVATNTSTRTLTLGGSNTGNNQIQGTIQDNNTAGNGRIALTKSGIGTWVLSGSNSYTGSTAVQAGTLIAETSSPSGGSGAFGNATSEINLGVASSNSDAGILTGGAVTIGRTIRLLTNNTTDAGTRVLTLGGNTAANSEFSGSIILGTASQAGRGVTLTAANGGQVTFSGVIQNPSGMDATTYTVTKSGAGTVILSNTNTYTGSTTVSEGTLALGANNVLPTTAVTIGNATLDAATFDDTVGTLDPSGSAVINLGSGANLAFAASNAVDWTGGALNITGTFVPGNGANPGVSTNPGSLRFGTSNAGLSVGQLSQITASGWTNFGLDAYGFLTADPTGSGSPEISVDPTAAAFGNVTLGSHTSQVFTIANSGSAPLNLTGTPLVAVSGINAADFTVTATPTSPVTSSGGTTTFTVRFAPSAAGARSALLTIANDDSDEGTFTIAVSGTGQTSFDAWSAGAAFDADANGDGVDNGLAFLLGAANPNDSALGLLPTANPTSGGDLVLNFNILKSANRGAATVNIEHSNDLGTSDAWAGATVPETTSTVNGVDFTITPGAGTTNNVQATIPSSEAASGRLFGRLKAQP